MNTTDEPVDADTSLGRVDADHVPVEHRVAGFDRRTIAPGLAVLALAAAMAVALPAIDDAIEYDDHIEAGTTIELGSVTFAPTAGWGEISDDTDTGSAADHAVVGDGTARFSLWVHDSDATAAELLDQSDTLAPDLDEVQGFHVAGAPSSYTTTQGVTGVIERFTGAASEGFVATFADGGVGVVVVVSAGENDLQHHSSEINQMLHSIQFAGGGSATGGDQP